MRSFRRETIELSTYIYVSICTETDGEQWTKAKRDAKKYSPSAEFVRYQLSSRCQKRRESGKRTIRWLWSTLKWTITEQRRAFFFYRWHLSFICFHSSERKVSSLNDKWWTRKGKVWNLLYWLEKRKTVRTFGWNNKCDMNIEIRGKKRLTQSRIVELRRFVVVADRTVLAMEPHSENFPDTDSAAADDGVVRSASMENGRGARELMSVTRQSLRILHLATLSAARDRPDMNRLLSLAWETCAEPVIHSWRWIDWRSSIQWQTSQSIIVVGQFDPSFVVSWLRNAFDSIDENTARQTGFQSSEEKRRLEWTAWDDHSQWWSTGWWWWRWRESSFETLIESATWSWDDNASLYCRHQCRPVICSRCSRGEKIVAMASTSNTMIIRINQTKIKHRCFWKAERQMSNTGYLFVSSWIPPRRMMMKRTT